MILSKRKILTFAAFIAIICTCIVCTYFISSQNNAPAPTPIVTEPETTTEAVTETATETATETLTVEDYLAKE